MLLEVPVADIVIGERHRQDMGDLETLAESMRELGLLQPIGITEDRQLVFGERRVKAAQMLGWACILARVVDISSIVAGEYAENEIRKDFTPSERVAIVEAMRTLHRGGDRVSEQFRHGGIAVIADRSGRPARRWRQPKADRPISLCQGDQPDRGPRPAVGRECRHRHGPQGDQEVGRSRQLGARAADPTGLRGAYPGGSASLALCPPAWRRSSVTGPGSPSTPRFTTHS
jgi:hypothetical protein